MKRLYILRHAQAAPAGGFVDFERPLTSQGRKEAAQLGELMKEKNYLPSYIFCSPALRTSETLSGLLQSLGEVQADYVRIIYEGGLPDLKNLLSQAGNAHSSILILGHNPSIHQLAFDLSNDGGRLASRLDAGYPPATLSVLDCPIAEWSMLQSAENDLIDLILAG